MNARLFRNATMGWAMACLLAAVAQAAVRVEAYRGEPFGVGRVTVDLPQETTSGDDRFALADAEGRVLYPVLEHRQLGRIVRRFINIELPNRATYYFLFRGDGPLRLTLYAPRPLAFDVEPENDPEERQELMEDWWDALGDRYERVHREAEYPIVVENYVVANWARRLGEEMPEPGLALLGQRRIGGAWVARLTANEAYQAEIEREIVLGRFGANQPADEPLPPSPFAGVAGGSPAARPQPPDELPSPGANVEIEPLAMRVPQECLYLRFGNFTNYLWYRDFLRHWQNDLGNMVVLRSINRQTRERLQQQLAIKETELARIMGPRVIRDVAFIGFDNYLRDGAAFGILFEAHNSLLLRHNFNEQRDEALNEHDGATLETVEIAGHEVSFLSTPDGKLRSYYVEEGDFHLITTCRRMVERFLEVVAADGGGSIGALAEFRQARAAMPEASDATVFAYLSRPFFENLASPAYRVELDRRLRSFGEMRVLEIARIAAAAEGSPARGIDEFIREGFLPAGFGRRSDGSQLMDDESGYRDSLRGMPGWFVPVPDMPAERVTRAEAARYAAFVQSIDTEVGRFVPVVAAVKARTLDGGERDRITIDVRVAPYSETRMVKWARMLGPATPQRVAPIEGDVASLELVLDALGETVHLFGGVRDFRTPLVVRQGEARPEAALEDYMAAYVGTWPRPLTLVDRFLGRSTGPPDADGISRRDGLFGLWQQRHDDFFLFSLQRDVLAEVGPQLAMQEAATAAQIRLHIDDLSDKEIATGVNGLGYSRSRKASASASRFMNSLTTQLHVPPEDARAVAERLVGGEFVCPLGGEYQLLEAGDPAAAAAEHLPTPGSRRLWASTAVAPENRFLLTEIPPDYQMPLMNWFRGLEAEVVRDDAADALAMHAELDMVHQEIAPPTEESEGGSKLPSLGNLFGWGGSDEEEAEKKPQEPPADAAEVPAVPPPASVEDIPEIPPLETP